MTDKDQWTHDMLELNLTTELIQVDYAELKPRLQELERLRDIMWCIVRSAGRKREYRGGPLWGRIADLCGIGSTSAIEMCRRYGVDPEGKVKQ